MAIDGSIIALVLVIGLSAWWAWTIKGREHACDLARRFCALNDWQLLDQTVSLTGAKFNSTPDGLRVCRRYHFEFSTDGGNRHRGTLWMLSQQIQHISTDFDKTHGPMGN